MNLIDCRVEGCSGLTSDASGVCPACQTKIQRREIDRDLCGGTTSPDRPRAYREKLTLAALALFILFAYMVGGTLDHQAATATQIGGK
jgi:hypothetical protein